MIQKKKQKSPRFPIFRFYSTRKIENSEISESFILLQPLIVVYETLDPNTKKRPETKKV